MTEEEISNKEIFIHLYTIESLLINKFNITTEVYDKNLAESREIINSLIKKKKQRIFRKEKIKGE